MLLEQSLEAPVPSACSSGCWLLWLQWLRLSTTWGWPGVRAGPQHFVPTGLDVPGALMQSVVLCSGWRQRRPACFSPAKHKAKAHLALGADLRSVSLRSGGCK